MPKEIESHILIPRQLLEVLHTIMGNLPCCNAKRGILEEAIYIYEQKPHCIDCLQKVVDSLDPETKPE